MSPEGVIKFAQIYLRKRTVTPHCVVLMSCVLISYYCARIEHIRYQIQAYTESAS